MCELFNQLNAPFPYDDYEYNKEDDRVYVNGQAVAERLNKVLGVGFWHYEPIFESIKIVERQGSNKVINMVTLLVKFSFYNEKLNQWITFVDAGSQDLNIRMTEGDATKSAITDGMKKCASRIGVASDLYKGLVNAKNGAVILPESYKDYYSEKGWTWHTPTNSGSGTQKLSDGQVKRAFAIAKGKGYSETDVKTWVLKKYKKTNVEDLTRSEYDEFCKGMECMEKKAG